MPPKGRNPLALRHARMQLRARMAPLRLLRVTDATRQRYYQSIVTFVERMYPWLAVMMTMEDLEYVTSLYVELLWENGHSRGEASYCCAAIQFYLNRRHILGDAWQLIQTWRRQESPRRVAPLPADVCLAMAGWALYSSKLDIAVLLI